MPATLSVIVPVFNEIRTIEAILSRVREAPIDKEVIVVDDGSTDGTRERLKELVRSEPGWRVVLHDRNRGKSAAVITGLAEATGEVVIVQDADLEYDPAEYEKVVAPILSGEADVVYGSRILGRNRASSLRYYLGGRAVTVWANLLYGGGLTDLPTCYKAFRRSMLTALPLKEQRFGFCAEVTALTLLNGVRIVEVPISYRPRSMTEGKKIRWIDGLRQLWILLSLRLTGRRAIRRKARGERT